ncbi:MAG TPA: hypothetical protein GXX30_07120 [Firmicutes bacterium]|nr:hypothetical protein [Candidatus Fermentithermobacillaceae bacterium]
MAVGNFIGYKVPIAEAIPGMLILLVIILAGLLLAKIIPLKIPGIAWITLVGTLVSAPFFPLSDKVIAYVAKINLLATATPVLAYAGIALGKDLGAFKKIGWRIIVVSFAVFVGTYVGSAIIAHLVLKMQGII